MNKTLTEEFNPEVIFRGVKLFSRVVGDVSSALYYDASNQVYWLMSPRIVMCVKTTAHKAEPDLPSVHIGRIPVWGNVTHVKRNEHSHMLEGTQYLNTVNETVAVEKLPQLKHPWFAPAEIPRGKLGTEALNGTLALIATGSNNLWVLDSKHLVTAIDGGYLRDNLIGAITLTVSAVLQDLRNFCVFRGYENGGYTGSPVLHMESDDKLIEAVVRIAQVPINYCVGSDVICNDKDKNKIIFKGVNNNTYEEVIMEFVRKPMVPVAPKAVDPGSEGTPAAAATTNIPKAPTAPSKPEIIKSPIKEDDAFTGRLEGNTTALKTTEEPLKETKHEEMVVTSESTPKDVKVAHPVDTTEGVTAPPQAVTDPMDIYKSTVESFEANIKVLAKLQKDFKGLQRPLESMKKSASTESKLQQLQQEVSRLQEENEALRKAHKLLAEAL